MALVLNNINNIIPFDGLDKPVSVKGVITLAACKFLVPEPAQDTAVTGVSHATFST